MWWYSADILRFLINQADTALVTAQKEYGTVAEQATKGFSNVVTRARGLSLSNPLAAPPSNAPANSSDPLSSATTGIAEEGLFSKLKKTAAQRIHELEEAEKRADAYLEQFGSQIGSFLRDAVTITPPDENASGSAANEVLFETKAGSTAGKQIYTSRLDAQLHLLHTNVELFKTDPKPESFTEYKKNFKAEDTEVTERIAKDLEAFPELRKAMEALVPEQVDYVNFWARYYFFREELDRDEKKRKELLKGAAIEEEVIGWDEDDESEEESEEDSEEDENEDDEYSDDAPAQPKTAQQKKPEYVKEKASLETLTPQAPRQSTDRISQPDSESSYDLVSGAPSKSTSQGPDSPPAKVAKVWGLEFLDTSDGDANGLLQKVEESDEEDWE